MSHQEQNAETARLVEKSKAVVRRFSGAERCIRALEIQEIGICCDTASLVFVYGPGVTSARTSELSNQKQNMDGATCSENEWEEGGLIAFPVFKKLIDGHTPFGKNFSMLNQKR